MTSQPDTSTEAVRGGIAVLRLAGFQHVPDTIATLLEERDHAADTIRKLREKKRFRTSQAKTAQDNDESTIRLVSDLLRINDDLRAERDKLDMLSKTNAVLHTQYRGVAQQRIRDLEAESMQSNRNMQAVIARAERAEAGARSLTLQLDAVKTARDVWHANALEVPSDRWDSGYNAALRRVVDRLDVILTDVIEVDNTELANTPEEKP